VKRLLLNCDQVFEVLTRGPFPSGDPQDEAVERHLRACHECRRLAEALRPAVALMHEAVSSEEAEQLPEYQGSLPWQRRPGRRMFATAHLAISPNPPAVVRNSVPAEKLGQPRRPQMVSAIRMIAASLIVAALGLLFGGSVFSPSTGTRSEPVVKAELPRGPGRSLADGVPSAQGLITLASLKLPTTCLPAAHRPISAEEARQIADAMSSGTLSGLRCCTECHHAGITRPAAANLVLAAQQSCQACHRG
jgi:hypothetical protein